MTACFSLAFMLAAADDALPFVGASPLSLPGHVLLPFPMLLFPGQQAHTTYAKYHHHDIKHLLAMAQQHCQHPYAHGDVSGALKSEAEACTALLDRPNLTAHPKRLFKLRAPHKPPCQPWSGPAASRCLPVLQARCRWFAGPYYLVSCTAASIPTGCAHRHNTRLLFLPAINL